MKIHLLAPVRLSRLLPYVRTHLLKTCIRSFQRDDLTLTFFGLRTVEFWMKSLAPDKLEVILDDNKTTIMMIKKLCSLLSENPDRSLGPKVASKALQLLGKGLFIKKYL